MSRRDFTSTIRTKLPRIQLAFPTGLYRHSMEYVGDGSATDAELNSPPVPDWKGDGRGVEQSVPTCTGGWRTRWRESGKRSTTLIIVSSYFLNIPYLFVTMYTKLQMTPHNRFQIRNKSRSKTFDSDICQKTWRHIPNTVILRHMRENKSSLLCYILYTF